MPVNQLKQLARGIPYGFKFQVMVDVVIPHKAHGRREFLIALPELENAVETVKNRKNEGDIAGGEGFADLPGGIFQRFLMQLEIIRVLLASSIP